MSAASGPSGHSREVDRAGRQEATALEWPALEKGVPFRGLSDMLRDRASEPRTGGRALQGFPTSGRGWGARSQ